MTQLTASSIPPFVCFFPNAIDTMASTMIALPVSPNLMMPLQIPCSDPQVGALRQMFPDIDVETLVLMLRHHDDNLEATVATLLDLGDDVGTNDDAAIARALQTEYDAVWNSDASGNASPYNVNPGLKVGAIPFTIGTDDSTCGVTGHTVIVHKGCPANSDDPCDPGVRIGCCVLE